MGNLTREDTVLTVQGTEIPRLGFGTWQLTGHKATEAVRDALEIGYRHVDPARTYRNEAEVAAGIAASGVDRYDVFLTTKVFPSDLEPTPRWRTSTSSTSSSRTPIASGSPRSGKDDRTIDPSWAPDGSR